MCFQQKKLSKSEGYIYLRIEVTLIFLNSGRSCPGSFRSFSISWYGTNQQANGKMYKITQGCKFEWRKYLDLSPEKNLIHYLWKLILITFSSNKRANRSPTYDSDFNSCILSAYRTSQFWRPLWSFYICIKYLLKIIKNIYVILRVHEVIEFQKLLKIFL